MYIYEFQSGAGCYTVGYYQPQGKWKAESDHNTAHAAAKRVHYLNGGTDTETVDRQQHAAALEIACLNAIAEAVRTFKR